MNIIFKETPDGRIKITKFAFWGTLVLILALLYFGCGGLIGSLQTGGAR